MDLSSRKIQRLAPAPQRLARALIADAKDDVRQALEVGVRLGSDQSVTEVKRAMGLSQRDYTIALRRVQRAARRLG